MGKQEDRERERERERESRAEGSSGCVEIWLWERPDRISTANTRATENTAKQNASGVEQTAEHRAPEDALHNRENYGYFFAG